MRNFLTGRLPDPARILLVESGSRGILEGVAAGLRVSWAAGAPIDLVTCYSGLPAGLDPENARVYRTGDHSGKQRLGLVRGVARNGYSHLGIICSGEPALSKWKWALAFGVPAKVFIINENGDYFWLDRKHLAPLRLLLAQRTGLADAGAVRTLARVLSFPFTLAYLILYAATAHARRALRGI